MKIVLFSHPSFMKSKSMPRFASMLEAGYKSLGYEVSVYSPKPFFYKLSKLIPKSAKWLGYIDQYIIFPAQIKAYIVFNKPIETVFVFCDQALGPWVPLVKNYPHAIHVHDLLALKSALGLVKINKTKWTGRLYQRFIKNGFEKGRCFISISKKTTNDLEELSNIKPTISEVVFNGLNYPYKRISENLVQEQFSRNNIHLNYKGYLFNIGGNQWYKNRLGLIYLYKYYVMSIELPLPLVILGPKASNKEQEILSEISTANKSARVLFLKDIDAMLLNALYSGARCLLFPSHEEGFGWPIIESQSSGTCVLTTDSAPMNEIAGDHSILFSSTENYRDNNIDVWAKENTKLLLEFLMLPKSKIMELEKKSIGWAENFSEQHTLDKYLTIYKKMFEK